MSADLSAVKSCNAWFSNSYLAIQSDNPSTSNDLVSEILKVSCPIRCDSECSAIYIEEDISGELEQPVVSLLSKTTTC